MFKEEARWIFKDTIDDIAAAFDIDWVEKADFNVYQPYGQRCLSNFWKATASILHHCIVLEMANAKRDFILRVINSAATAPEFVFDVFHLPFLKELAEWLKLEALDTGDSELQLLYQQILGKHVVRVVELEPKKPENWTQEPVECKCDRCALLNEFLIDPEKKTRTFGGSQKDRYHLQRQATKRGASIEDDKTARMTKITKVHEYDSEYREKPHRDAFAKYLESFSERMLMDLLGDLFWPTLAADVAYLTAALEDPEMNSRVTNLAVKDEVSYLQASNDFPYDYSSDEDENKPEKSFVHV